MTSSDSDQGESLAWVVLHQIRGDLDQAMATVNGSYKNRLRLTADLIQLDDQREETEMAGRFSVEYLKKYGSIMDSYHWIAGTEMINPIAGYELAIQKLAQFGENWGFVFE